MNRRLTAGLFLFLASGVSASAATVLTFDGVSSDPYDGPQTYVESGVTVSGRPAYYGTPGVVHMDDAGTPFSQTISVTTGADFSALAVDIIGLPQESYFESEDGEIPVAHRNVWFRGYLDGALVAELGYSSGLLGSDRQVRFGPEFGTLDAFTISAETEFLAGMLCRDAPCGHFEVDNLIVGAPDEVLAPIPLPASGLALLAGLGVLWARRQSLRSA